MQLRKMTMTDHPTNVAVFRAAGWNEAVKKFQTALIDDRKESAVWFRGPLALSKVFNATCEQFYRDHLKENAGKNWAARDEFFLRSSFTPPLNPFVECMSLDEIEAAQAFFECGADLRIIKRFQVKTPHATSVPHFDMSSSLRKTSEKENFPKERFGLRRTRFLLSQDGDGPVLFEKPREELILDQDGFVQNPDILADGWQVPGETVTAITGEMDWGDRAILHSSPAVTRPVENPRRQTVFDLVY